MTKPDTQKQSNKTRRPTCQNPACKKRFTTAVATAKYCSTKCGDATRNSRKRVDPLEKALKSAFFYYIAGECLRANTLEILQGHTLESLCELHGVYKSNMKWNGYGGSNAYELSHIAPVKGHGRVGMLFAENLVSAPKALNRAHGNKHFGFGRSIGRLTLNPKHSIDKRWNSPSEVVQMVISYLGKELVLAVTKACKIKPAQRSQLVEWILAHYDQANPRHLIALGDLSQVHDLKTQQLKHVKNAMLDEEAGEYFASPAAHPAIVLCNELTRLSAYRPELEVYAYALDEALKTQEGAYSLFSKHHEQMLFDVLHGKSIAVMADTLEMVIGENNLHSFITYEDSVAELPRYHVDAFHFVAKPRAGAKLRRMSLATFKASISERGTDVANAVLHLHNVLPMDVFDPWGNKVEQPPF